MRSSTSTLAVFASVAALGIAACGGGDAATSTPGDAAKTATKAPIKIGLINPTGAFVSNPDVNASMQAGVTALNARGGLGGHKVELVICNDKADATLAAKCGRQMVTDKVVAVVGGLGINDQNSQPTIQAAGIPEILPRASAETVLNGPNVFLPTGGTPLSYPIAAGYFAKKLKVPYTFMISDSPNAVGLRKSLMARFKAADASPVGEQKVNPQQADFAPVVAAARKGDAKAVIAVLPFQQVAIFMRSAGSAGAPFDHVSANTIFNPSMAKEFGGVENLDKVVSVTALPPITSDKPGAQQYTTELKAREATGDKDAAIAAQTGSGFAAWLCLLGLEQAVTQTKTTDITPAGLTKALSTAKDLDLGGLIPPWTPGKAGPEGMSRLSNDAYYIVGYKQGEPYLMQPDPVTVENAMAGNF
jgi:branched-chain amino acid transport system substrate-binding protein